MWLSWSALLPVTLLVPTSPLVAVAFRGGKSIPLQAATDELANACQEDCHAMPTPNRNADTKSLDVLALRVVAKQRQARTAIALSATAAASFGQCAVVRRARTLQMLAADNGDDGGDAADDDRAATTPAAVEPEAGFDGAGLAGYLLPYAGGGVLALALAAGAFSYLVLGSGM